MAGLIDYGPAAVIFLGAVLSATGGIWSAVNQQNLDRVLTEQNNDLTAKSTENLELSRQLTGFDAYCMVSGMMLFRQKVTFQIIHSGRYPLYDVKMTMYQTDALEAVLEAKGPFSGTISGSAEEIAAAVNGKEFDLGSMSPGQIREIPVTLGPASNHFFSFAFTARNGKWDERFLIARSEAETKVAWRVVRDGKEINKKLDDDFPAELRQGLDL